MPEGTLYVTPIKCYTIDVTLICIFQPPPDVEHRLKVIRDDSSSDIKIRPESVTIQKHEMIIDSRVGVLH